MSDFLLDSQLAADSVFVTEWPFCHIRLMNDQRFPWLVMIPRIHAAREVFDLTPSQQTLLWAEVNAASYQLRQLTNAFKMNVATLGNMVPQLHIHVIARFEHDAAWPKPVWGQGETLHYGPTQLQQFTIQLKHRLIAP